MKSIRYNIFETNSSSTHSLVVNGSTKGILGTIHPDKNGIIYLNGGKFGQEWKKYNKPLDKANYCAIDCRYDSDETDMNLDKINMLIEVIKEHTGAKEVVLNIDNKSYIDHQSAGLTAENFVDKETLRNFIFDYKNWICTGNDNEHAPINFYDVGEVKYKYQLSIDNIDKIVFFKRKPDEKEVEEAIRNIIFFYPKFNRTNRTSYITRYCFSEDIHNNTNIDWNHSFSRMKENIITFYKVKEYIKDHEFHDKVLETYEVKFELKKL